MSGPRIVPHEDSHIGPLSNINNNNDNLLSESSSTPSISQLKKHEPPYELDHSPLPSNKKTQHVTQLQQPTQTSTTPSYRKLYSSVSENLRQTPKHPFNTTYSKSTSLFETKKSEATLLVPVGADPLWYFGSITRQETEALFNSLKKNLLMVRISAKRLGCWALSLGYTEQKPAHIIIATKLVDGKPKWYLENSVDKSLYDSIVELLVQSPECDTHAFAGSVVKNTWFSLTPISSSKSRTPSVRSSVSRAAPTSTFLELESS